MKRGFFSSYGFLIFLFIGQLGWNISVSAQSSETCAEALTKRSEHLPGASFLLDITPQMHKAASVETRATRQGRIEKRRLTKPRDKVSAWLNALAKIDQQLLANPKLLRHVKAHLYKGNVIRPEEIPESYFQTQARLLRNEGYGDVHITREMKESIQELLIKDQALSLEPWIDYLFAADRANENYPVWLKYWILNGVVKLSIYDPGRRAFGLRNRQTVAPFPELNREALSRTKELILARFQKSELPGDPDDRLKALVRTANFGQIYAHEINKLSQYGNRPFLNNDGQWVRYPQNSDPKLLVAALEGQNTGWCTAGRATAEQQLAGGDFHVYFSRDDEGHFSRPRLAIRMGRGRIGEIRGVGHDQEFDPLINESNVLEEKLKEFGSEASAYIRRSADMKRLTAIENRVKKMEPLDKEDLFFLREIDHEIQGFGHSKDPRIAELLQGRDLRSDYSLIFDVDPSEIALSSNEYADARRAIHVGDFEINETNSQRPLPTKAVIGKVKVRGIAVQVFSLPSFRITGDLTFETNFQADVVRIEADVKKVIFSYPKGIGEVMLPPTVEHLQLRGVKKIKTLGHLRGLKRLDIDGLESAEELDLPATQEDWVLKNLQSVTNLTVAPGINSLYLPSLLEAQSITLPDGLRSVRLPKFRQIQAIQSWPQSVRELILGGIGSAKELTWPTDLERLWLDAVTDAAGLEHLPAGLKSLELDSLVDAEGLNIPQGLETLWLPKLPSARDILKPTDLNQMRYRGPTDFKEE